MEKSIEKALNDLGSAVKEHLDREGQILSAMDAFSVLLRQQRLVAFQVFSQVLRGQGVKQPGALCQVGMAHDKFQHHLLIILGFIDNRTIFLLHTGMKMQRLHPIFG